MTKTQKELLRLLKEVDVICKENDITYYLAYGTVIGALRHKGFIPWDKDLDIILKEQDYYRLVEACNKNTEQSHRVIYDNRINPEYPTVFGRYIDKETTKIMKHSPFWSEAGGGCGACIDVFYMIPLPKEQEKMQYIMTLFCVYDEYMNNSFRHHGNRIPMFDELWDAVLKREKKHGREDNLRWMESQIFNQQYDDFDYYMVSTAGVKTPYLFKREWFEGDPVYLDYEGEKFPVEPMYAHTLRYLYGDDYYVLPDEPQLLNDIHNTEIPCSVYINDYMRMLDKEKMLEDRKSFKYIHLYEGLKKRPVSASVHGISAYRISRHIETVVEQEQINLFQMLEDKKYKELDKLFSEFYEYQFSSGFKYWPIIIELKDEYLYVAILNLLIHQNKLGKAGYLIKLRKERGPLSDKLKELDVLFELIFTIRSEFDYGHYEIVKRAISEGKEKFSNIKEIQIGDLMMKVFEASTEFELDECEVLAKELLSEYPENGEIIKYLGDVYYKRGDYTNAKMQYDQAETMTQNGMVLLDISEKKGGMIIE